MALFRITVIRNKYSNTVKLEKGMSVEVSSTSSNPITSNTGQVVQDAFINKYGIDIRKCTGGGVSNIQGYVKLEKLG